MLLSLGSTGWRGGNEGKEARRGVVLIKFRRMRTVSQRSRAPIKREKWDSLAPHSGKMSAAEGDQAHSLNAEVSCARGVRKKPLETQGVEEVIGKAHYGRKGADFTWKGGSQKTGQRGAWGGSNAWEVIGRERRC